MNVTVLVMAKAPVAGQAKTRLIPAHGPVGAADLAAAALLDTLQAAVEAAELLDPGRRPVVALTGELARAERRCEVVAALARCRVIPQRGADFGHRLVAAHQDAGDQDAADPDDDCRDGKGQDVADHLTGRRNPATRPSRRAVLQIGMDTPQVTADLLVRCADGLRTADAVLAPAQDGGWWLLGLRDAGLARVLATVPMSTPSTGALTASALRGAGARMTTGPTLSDVDTPQDALAVAALAPGTRFAQTMRALIPA